MAFNFWAKVPKNRNHEIIQFDQTNYKLNILKSNGKICHRNDNLLLNNGVNFWAKVRKTEVLKSFSLIRQIASSTSSNPMEKFATEMTIYS